MSMSIANISTLSSSSLQSLKPPYRVPSMAEIEQIPWNGYKVVSTFSGCGGSCLGYRMAGYRVLWANEFIPAAQETYQANHPQSILDTRDIRQIQPEEILEAIGLAQGEIDILDGSPPCSSFSTAGKRERSWGQVRSYSDTSQRADDLFFEYARLLRGLQPKVFVAENVSGLVKGTAKGYFLEILRALRACGYLVEAKLLDAQWLGVPQARQRLIFIGIRNDIMSQYRVRPVHPLPFPYRYSVQEVLPCFLGKEVGETENIYTRALQIGGQFSKQYNTLNITRRPCPTVLTRVQFYLEYLPHQYVTETVEAFPLTPSLSVTQGYRTYRAKRAFTISELKQICAFPQDFILTGRFAQQWERLGRAVPPIMMMHVAQTIKEQVLDQCK